MSHDRKLSLRWYLSGLQLIVFQATIKTTIGIKIVRRYLFRFLIRLFYSLKNMKQSSSSPGRIKLCTMFTNSSTKTRKKKRAPRLQHENNRNGSCILRQLLSLKSLNSSSWIIVLSEQDYYTDLDCSFYYEPNQKSR